MMAARKALTVCVMLSGSGKELRRLSSSAVITMLGLVTLTLADCGQSAGHALWALPRTTHTGRTAECRG